MPTRIAALFISLLAIVGCDAALAGLDTVQWNSARPPIFADVDGDGALDVIGWVRGQKMGALTPRIAAFSGVDGRSLWMTATIAPLAEEHQVQFGYAGGRLVVVDAGGVAHGMVPTAQTPEWSIDLGERAVEICDGGATEVIVVTSDGAARQIAVADGSSRRVAAPTPCAPTGTAVPAVMRAHWHAVGRWPGVRVPPIGLRPEQAAPGMSSDSLLRPTPELTVLLGTKSVGTHIPMVAVLRGDQPLWTSVVPEDQPLRVETGGPKIAAADAQTVFVGYERTDSTWRVAAFALADGRRLWDAPVPSRPTDSEQGDLEMLVPVGDHLLAAHWTYLRVLDRNTGDERFTIGVWR